MTAIFEERATDKCGSHRCPTDAPCSCRDWAEDRIQFADEIERLRKRLCAAEIALAMEGGYKPTPDELTLLEWYDDDAWPLS
jgi:hypothetical protein